MKGSSASSFGLARLRELTEQLPPFPVAIKVNMPAMTLRDLAEDMPEIGSSSYKEYKMDQGECFAWFIHRSGNDVAVHRWFNSKGSVFPEHSHPEKEWIIVYRGVMEISQDGTTRRLEAGDYSYSEPFVRHGAYFPEECRYLTVTIPPAKEFPNVS
jgi:quercetin dioxygenase-like cupin family protein